MYHVLNQQFAFRLALSTFFVGVFSALWVGETWAMALTPENVLQEMNKDRAAAGLPALIVDDALSRAAQMKADDMAERQYFAHTSPEGQKPWHWFGQAKYSYRYAGENLAIRFTNVEDEERAWMESPSHRANILNENYRDTGIAVRTILEDGRPVLVTVQMFGLRTDAPLPEVAGDRTGQSGADADVPVRVESVSTQMVTNQERMLGRSFSDRLMGTGLRPETFALMLILGVLEALSAFLIGKMLRKKQA